MVTILNFLSGHEYRESTTKAQVASPEIKYPALILTPTTNSITADHKALLCDSRSQLQNFCPFLV